MIELEIEIRRCDTCHVAFVPGRTHCPRCGSTALRPATLPASGTVLAATELLVPPAGFDAPHRLALLELEEGVRLLATTRGELPAVGEKRRVRREGERFVLED